MSKRKRNITFRDGDDYASNKRPRDQNDTVGPREYSTLHQSSSSNARKSQQVDLYGGQVLGEVDGLSTHGDDHESAEDALAYLRSVRSEAQALPNMMRAQNPDVEEEIDVDDVNTNLYYDSEGTWVARPARTDSRASSRSRSSSVTLTNEDPSGPEPVSNKSVIPLILPIEALSTTLLAEFSVLRAQLRTLRNQIPSGDWHLYQPYELSNIHSTAYYNFRSSISQSPPLPIRLAATSKEMYLRLLLCASKLLKKGKLIDKMLSVWIFALLARCDDVGTLTNDDVFIVRSTAKKAIQMLSDFAKRNYLNAKTLDGAEDEGDHNLETEEKAATEDEAFSNGKDVKTEEVSTEKVEDQGLVQKDPVLLDMNTRATLYVIVLVAGDVYGQKDLLEYLERW